MVGVDRGRPLAQQRIVDAAASPARASKSSSVVGPMPHSTPPSDSDTRSLASVTLASAHPSFSAPDAVVDGDAHVGEEDLVEVVAAGHLDDRADLDAGRPHVEHEVRDALVLRRRRVGAGEQDPQVASGSAHVDQIFWPLTT